ncbi:MAG: hypothetical protein F7C07_08375 [Desulfurococcales archaeon]|nr:hypothetical protein [Desulfurococcales archaeon]
MIDHGNKERNNDMQSVEDALRLVRDKLASHLWSTAPGLLAVLNIYCRDRYGTEYLEILVREPGIAYNIALDYLGNEVSTKLFLLSLLKPVLGEETREAVRLLENGNVEGFRRLITSRAGRYP